MNVKFKGRKFPENSFWNDPFLVEHVYDVEATEVFANDDAGYRSIDIETDNNVGYSLEKLNGAEFSKEFAEKVSAALESGEMVDLNDYDLLIRVNIYNKREINRAIVKKAVENLGPDPDLYAPLYELNDFEYDGGGVVLGHEFDFRIDYNDFRRQVRTIFICEDLFEEEKDKMELLKFLNYLSVCLDPRERTSVTLWSSVRGPKGCQIVFLPKMPTYDGFIVSVEAAKETFKKCLCLEEYINDFIAIGSGLKTADEVINRYGKKH